jgi:L-ascorbate metabolism protein UlaG (beta-lactamase superfamily)
MHLQLIRHATLLIDYAEMRLLVDPMLSNVGAMPAIRDSPQPRPNPMVPLPCPATDIVSGVHAVLVTHTHRDHWDDAAIQLVPKDLPLFCQPEDLPKMEAVHFVNAAPVHQARNWSNICITRTGGQHGTKEIAEKMAPVSGYVLQGAGEPTVYIAGDTIWCDEVARAVRQFKPNVIVVNAGAARFLQGDPITMTAQDVIQVGKKAPHAKIIAVHMEAINHCLLTRKQLSHAARQHGVKIIIPDDGEVLTLGSFGDRAFRQKLAGKA